MREIEASEATLTAELMTFAFQPLTTLICHITFHVHVSFVASTRALNRVVA